MRITGFTAAAMAAVLWAAAGHAGEVYRCKGADGSVAFTNTKCPESSATERYASYPNAEDAPVHADQTAAGPSSDSAALGDAASSAHASNASAASSGSAAAGYQCSANGSTWVQPQPCPETSSRQVTESVNGTVVSTGEYVAGTVTRDETAAVSQRELSREDLCSHLESNPKTAERGRDSDSSYERRKLRHANGCR